MSTITNFSKIISHFTSQTEKLLRDNYNSLKIIPDDGIKWLNILPLLVPVKIYCVFCSGKTCARVGHLKWQHFWFSYKISAYTSNFQSCRLLVLIDHFNLMAATNKMPEHKGTTYAASYKIKLSLLPNNQTIGWLFIISPWKKSKLRYEGRKSQNCFWCWQQRRLPVVAWLCFLHWRKN